MIFSENFYRFSFLPFHELYEIKHIVKGNIECKMKRLHSLLKHLIRLHTNGSKKKRCEGFSTLITQKLLNTMWELTKAQSPPPQLIAKSHFKPDECKVICTQLIAMGTELQPSPPTIRALTIVSFKGLAIEFTESIYMMCCVNVTDTTAEERRWLWKRVGESSSRLLQLGVKVGNNGGGGGWGVERADTTEAVRFSMLHFHTYQNAARWFWSKTFGLEGSWNTHRSRGGALFLIHPFLVALNNHTDKKRRAFAGRRGHREQTWWIKHGQPLGVTTVHHICASFTRLALLSLWNHF